MVILLWLLQEYLGTIYSMMQRILRRFTCGVLETEQRWEHKNLPRVRWANDTGSART
jgi:hypothetical protein